MTKLTPMIDEFLETLNRSPLTIKAYRDGLNQFVETVGENAALTPDNYKAFLRSLKHKSPSTQRVRYTALRKFYRYWKAGNESELDEITDHYTRNEEESVVEFDEESINKFIAHIDGLRGDLLALRDRAFVLILDGSGLRISEATKLRVGNIDWKTKSAIIHGKRGRVAKVRFSDKAIDALREYLQARSAAIETRQSISSQPLFACHDIRARKRVKPISTSGIREAIKTRMEEAGIDRDLIRMHDFRHHLITIIYRASNNPKLAQAIARHKSVALTINRYSHFATNEEDTSYDQIINQK